MKKLLSILTITMLTASVSAPLLANTTLERAKRNIGVSNSNNDYLPLKEIYGITDRVNAIAVDKNNKIYFGTKDYAFVLKQGESTATKIDGINGRVKTAVDSKDNIF